MGTTESDLESYWKEEEEEEEVLKRRPARGTKPPVGAEEELLLASPQSDMESVEAQEKKVEAQYNADCINDAAVLVQLQVAAAATESERSVYFDTHDGFTNVNKNFFPFLVAEGTWKCHHCTWTYGMPTSAIHPIQNPYAHSHSPVNVKTLVQNGPSFSLEIKGTETCNETRGIKYSVAGHSVAEKNLQNEDSEFALHGVDSLKSQTTETDYQSYKNSKDEGKPNLHTLHSAKSSENGSAVCRPVDKPLHVGQSKESKQEVAEWDLERVLDEQETHDLYCPNCNSCITKRVILRKRKRKISNLQYESKREKTEANQSSSLSIGDRGHNTTLTGQDGIPAAVGTSGRDHETGPDLFRCLSCFSFFIPSVSGFKIFRIFGGRGEDQTVQNPQQIVPRDGAVTQDEKSATIFSPPTTTQLIVTDSSEQLNISKSKLWIDEQNVQVSATSVSVHHVETQFNTDEAHSNAGKRIEGGELAYNVLRESSLFTPDLKIGHGTDGRFSSSPYMDKNLAVNNIEPILSTLGTQSNGISNTVVEKDLSLINGKYISIVSKPEALLPSDKHTEIREDWESSHRNADAGNDVILLIRPDQVRPEVFESIGNRIESSAVPERYASGRQVEEARMSTQLDILKSIVYGVNIFALGLAAVVSGLFIIAHGLMDLKSEQYGGAANQTENADRYQELLGRRTNFGLHATVVIMSYLVFGLVPPVTYGFSFHESNNREYKLIVVAAVSLLCIALLATVKAYVRKPPKAYIKTLSYYIVTGVMSSGLSYAFGMLIKKLMEKLGWFEPTAADPMLPPAAFLESVAVKPSWISY
ncbi:hypothetical protein IFM89_037836 [Coptis chinensis]|uniref:Membrane protein of ER body-like protein n=1 Tax=Coptis chinensis TaxID=261450 RepID=A0A835HQ89_9MAGN|nr:hypothetical protein IFM89_037836 [Coptis chinensis]